MKYLLESKFNRIISNKTVKTLLADQIFLLIPLMVRLHGYVFNILSNIIYPCIIEGISGIHY